MTISAQAYNPPITRVFKNDTDAGEGFKLYFFETGTSTPKVVYADSALTTPLSNPVIADAYGRFPQIFCDPNNSVYKAVLNDADDVLVWSADPVDLSAILDINSLDFRPLQYWGQTTGTDVAYKVDPTPGIPSLYDGLIGLIQMHLDNDVTSEPTLEVLLANGGAVYSTAKKFKKYDANGGKIPLVAQDMTAGQRYIITYDGVDWVLLYPEHLYKQSLTADAIDVTTLNGVEPLLLGKSVGYLNTVSSTDGDNIIFGTNVIHAQNTDFVVDIDTGMTKDTSATWVAGDTNGGFFGTTPSPVDSTLFGFAIWKDDGTYDFGVSENLDPTGDDNYPSDYVNYKMVTAITTDGSGDVIPFQQKEKRVELETPVVDYSGVWGSGSRTPQVTSVPIGIPVIGIYYIQPACNDSTQALRLSPLYLPDVFNSASYDAFAGTSNTNISGNVIECDTDTQGRVGRRGSNDGFGAPLGTKGWRLYI